MDNKDLKLKTIVKIATQILKGLEDAKGHGIYHGDLNPENILVDELDNIKILNFGKVKANEGINTRSSNNIKYLSPYQLCINHTDIESDLFALGVILFPLFSSLPPLIAYSNALARFALAPKNCICLPILIPETQQAIP